MNPTYSASKQASRTAALKIGRRARNVAVERELDTQLDAVSGEEMALAVAERFRRIRVRAYANAQLLEGLPLYHGTAEA